MSVGNPIGLSSTSYLPSSIGYCTSRPLSPLSHNLLFFFSKGKNTSLSTVIPSSSHISARLRNSEWNSLLQNPVQSEDDDEDGDMHWQSHQRKPTDDADSQYEENKDEEISLEEEEKDEEKEEDKEEEKEEENEGAMPRQLEDRKVYVVNLPFYMDSAKLAELFKPAGVVEVSQVIYSRETGQSRGFGFVTMSTAEEAKQALQMFSQYEIEGRPLRAKMALVKSPGREFTPPSKVFVRNLPSGAGDEDLARFFGKHVEVAAARVICDRETGESRGYGFVTLTSEEDLQRAIEAFDGQRWNRRRLTVSRALRNLY